MSSHSFPRPRRDAGRFGRPAIAAAVVAALVAIVAAGALLLHTRSGGSARVLAASGGPPSVLSRAFVGLPLAGHDRDVLVGLGARRDGPVDVVVIPSDESAVRPADIRVSLGRNTLSGASAASCGKRCLRFPLAVLAGKASVVEVEVVRSGRKNADVRLQIPAQMPPGAESLFHTARARMLRLRSLEMNETLGAGLSKPVVSRWWFQAPDRMRYAIVGGERAVVIGTRRWDAVGRKWQQSSTSRLRFPAFSWEHARGARLLGRSTLDGVPVRIVAARTPGADLPTWFLLDVTAHARVLRARMLTTAHFMTDTYSRFDSAPAIRPPR